MPRQKKYRSIDDPWLEDAEQPEPDWKAMTKAQAIRMVSKRLGDERSPIKVIRFLAERGIKITSAQAAQTLVDLYRTPERLAAQVQAVLAVQRYAAAHGGPKALAEKLQELESLMALADSVGGLAVVRMIVDQLLAAAAAAG
jgi:hypothetical protein